jgi:Tol biopolymer transport system component
MYEEKSVMLKMSKAKAFLLLLCALAVSLPAAELYLAGRDGQGDIFAHGSGYGLGTYFRPSVFDDGRVAFLAVMPDYASSDSLFRAAYSSAPMVTAAAASTLFVGRDEFAFAWGNEWPLTNWALAADQRGQSFFSLRQEQFADLANSSAAYLRSWQYGVLGGLALGDMQLADESRLCCSGDGTRLFVYERGKARIRSYAVDSSTLRALADIVLPGGTAGELSYDGQGVATNGAGDSLAFAASGQGEGLGIYCYELASGKVSAVAQGVGLSGSDCQVSMSAHGGVLAFRATLSSFDDSKTTGSGSRVYVASPEDGAYWFQLCSKDLHGASAPQLSSDGRYVVFCASNTVGGSQQIWRFDRLTGEQREVSKTATSWANQDCMVPAVSPTGRYAAFVSAATNLGVAGIGDPQVWLADLGPTLRVADFSQLPGEQELPLSIDGAAATATLVLRLAVGSQLPAGIFRDGAGQRLSVGNTYLLAEHPLPWTYTAAASEIGRHYELQVQLLDDTYSSEWFSCAIRVNDCIVDLVSTDSGAFWGDVTADYSSLSMSADGDRIAFVTDANLLGEKDYTVSSRVYMRDVTRGRTYSAGKASYSACISGDGQRVFFVSSDGTLYEYQVSTGSPQPLAFGLDDIYAPIAVSHNGEAQLYKKDGGLVLRRAALETVLPLPGDTFAVINPSLSYDGQTAIFLARRAGSSSDSLYAFYETAPDELQLLLNEVIYASLSMSGATAVVMQHDGQGGVVCKRIAVGGTERQEQPLPITVASRSSTVLSGNARQLAYVAVGDIGKQQLYSYDLSTQKVSPLTKINGMLGDADSDMEQPPVWSLSGEQLAFVSAAGNLLPGDDNGGKDVFRVTVPPSAHTAPRLQTLGGQKAPANRIFALTTDEDVPLFLAMSYLDDEGDDALPELVQAPAHGDVDFVGPDGQRAWYALRYRPEDNYIGSDSFVFRLWDGLDHSVNYTVNVTLESVNDAPYWLADIPTSLSSYKIKEGQSVQSAALRPYADDVDLRNPEPYVDALSFALAADAPSWVNIDHSTGVLSFKPGYELARRDQNDGQGQFFFGCLVKDLAGASARLEIEVVVDNVNRPPQILRCPAVAWEGVALPHSAFGFVDPDVEDPLASLSVELLSSAGTWRKTAAGWVFTAATTAYNSVSGTLRVLDSAGMASERSMDIHVLRVQQSLQALWPAEDGMDGTALREGWQLLAMPYKVDAAAMAQLRSALGAGAALWRWDQSEGRYAVAASLAAGEGFWCYLPSVPGDMSAKIIGRREMKGRSYGSGWQLVGLRSDEDSLGQLPEGPCFWRLSAGEHIVQQPSTGSFILGRGYWLFYGEE